MSNDVKVISIDGVDYVRKDQISTIPAEQVEGLDLVIVRSSTASPFIGYLEKLEGTTATLKLARRIRTWYGAMDLSQLANDGTQEPAKCQFSAKSGQIKLVTNVSEVHIVSAQAAATFEQVEAWEV